MESLRAVHDVALKSQCHINCSLRDALSLMVRQREFLVNRIHISEYAKIEVALIENFNKATSSAPSQQVEKEGFVSLVGGRKFILRPSLAVNFGLLCDANSLRSLPADYECVRVKGYRTLLNKTSRFAAKDSL